MIGKSQRESTTKQCKNDGGTDLPIKMFADFLDAYQALSSKLQLDSEPVPTPGLCSIHCGPLFTALRLDFDLALNLAMKAICSLP